MKEIPLREAKAKLSAVVDDALAGTPAVITRHGKPRAVIVSYEEWKRLSNVPSFAQMLMSMPEGIEEYIERDQTPFRDPEL